MKWFTNIPVVLLATGASAAKVVTPGSPVSKVVTLLTDLKARLTADEYAEQQVYNKYSCWCESTSARKADNIETAKTDLKTLGQDIVTLKGKSATLSSEIASHLSDIKENEQAQAEATAIRQKESAAWLAESAELKQALDALEKSLMLLKSAASGSFLQKGSDQGSAAQEATLRLRAVVMALPTEAKVAPEKVALLRKAASGMGDKGKAGFTPQSASIQGILEEMYKQFTTDLETKTSEEATANTNFEGLMATKHEEIAAMNGQVTKKDGEKAETDKTLAATIETYDDTDRQMNADIEFFDAMKESCAAKNDEWTIRSGLRADEIKGIADALAILNTDEARELFSKSIKPGAQAGQASSLLQVASVSAGVPAKVKAYAALKKFASKSHSIRLAKLAVTLSSATAGHFDEVIAAIDTLIGTLKTEETDDAAKRDQCKEEYTKINSTISDLAWKIEVNEAAIEKFEAEIEKAEKEKAETILAIEDVIKTMAEMKATRDEENAAFLQAKSEDEQAIDLLDQAKTVFAAYYVNNDIEMGPIEGPYQLLQKEEPTFARDPDEAPDANFNDKGHRMVESKGIVSILTNIIEDLHGEIRVMERDEAAALAAYEKALAAAEQLQADLEAKKVTLEGVIAETTESKRLENVKLTANEADKKEEEDYFTSIKPDCDFIMGAFEERMSKRQAEMDGLVQAKAFLAGAQAKMEA